MRIAAIVFAFFFVPVVLRAAITGVVLDEDGKPVADARISAFAPESQEQAGRRLLSKAPERRPVVTTSTKRDGSFSFDTNLAAVDVVVTAPGRGYNVMYRANPDDLGPLLLRTAPLRKGRVTSEGKPVIGAAIQFGESYLTRTDSNGVYEVPNPATWEMSAWVTHPDFAPSQFVVLWGDLDFELDKGEVIEGRVITADGKPVKGAAISIAGWPLAESQEDGSFRIAHAPSWSSKLIARTSDRVGVVSRGAEGSVQIVMQASPTITGVVRRRGDGSAIAGARVIASAGENEENAAFALTDSTGKFNLTGLYPGKFRLYALHPQFEMQEVDVELTPGQALNRSFTLTQYSILRGRVVDQRGLPVAGAVVSVGLLSEVFRQVTSADRAVTDVNGRFAMRRTSGTARDRLFIYKSGYAMGEASLDQIQSNRETVVTLEPGLELRLKVTDRKGAPVERARVYVDPVRERGEILEIRDCLDCLTDSQGYFVTRLREKKYQIRVYGPGIVDKVIDVDLRRPTEIAVVDPAAGIVGRVLYDDGSAVPVGTNVRTASGENTTTEAGGLFVFANVPPGPVTVYAQLETGERSDRKEITAPSMDVVLEFPKPASLSGQVLDEGGKPVKAFAVGMWKQPGLPWLTPINAPNGHFTLPNVPDGTFDLIVTAPGYVTYRRSEITRATRDLAIRLVRGARVAGRVTSSNGAPLGEVDVILIGDVADLLTRFLPRATKTAANGDYVLDGVPPGEHSIAFRKENFREVKQDVSIEEAKDILLNVELQRGRTLQGRVIDERGQPVVEATVTASGPPNGRASDLSGETDQAGAFRFDNAEEIPYTIEVFAAGYVKAAKKDVLPDGSDVVLELRRGATVRGKVVGVPDRELPRTIVRIYGDNWAGIAEVRADGSFETTGLADGSFSATAERPSGEKTGRREFTVENGSAPFLQLDFASGFVVRGRLTINGVPAPSATIGLMRKTPGDTEAVNTGRNGNFELRLTEGGTYQITPTVGDERLPTRTVTLSSGQTLNLDYQSSQLRLRVTDARTHNPIPNVRVVLDSTSTDRTTDANGIATLNALEPRRYVITIAHEGYVSTTKPLTVTAGTQSVEIPIEPGIRVNVRVRDTSGRQIPTLPIPMVFDDAMKPIPWVSTIYSRAEGVTVLWLAPGNYSVLISAQGYESGNANFAVPGPEVGMVLQQKNP